MPVESRITTIRQVPDVELRDISGDVRHLRQLTSGNVSVIFFSCNHCPYVKWIEKEIGKVHNENTHIVFIAICSNDVESYPDDDIHGLQEQARRSHWDFPYLVDSSQEIARTFGAVCTPDFYVFDALGALVYRGAFDDSRPSGDLEVNGSHLRNAIQFAIKGQKFNGGRPSLGCGIKWHSN